MLDELGPGEIGFFTASIKQVSDIGLEILLLMQRHKILPSGRFQALTACSFLWSIPTDTSDFEGLRDAIEKLSLNDASFQYEKETSAALGLGYRCGFRPTSPRNYL